MKHNPILLAVGLCALFGIRAVASTTHLLVPAPTHDAVLAPPADPDHFTFVVSGDNRSTGHGYPMPPVWAEICREIGWIHPAFLLTTGDAIEGYGDTVAEANAEYDVFLADDALADIPVFCAPGNHEFSLDANLLPVYEKRIGKLYGSFDYGNSHFVAVNTNAALPDGTIKGGAIDDAQMAWLESDLAANQGAKNIFLFLHHYVFGPPDPDTPDIDTGFVDTAGRDKFHALMVKYKVRAVFCGHNHIYWHQVKDGVDYFISGGGGAPLDASPENGGYLHYVVFTVDGSKFTTQILQPEHLEVIYPDGAEATGRPSQRVWITNTNATPITVKHIILHVAALPAGQALALTATVAYKKINRPGVAQILSQSQGTVPGTLDIVVQATVPKARTIEITVAPAPVK